MSEELLNDSAYPLVQLLTNAIANSFGEFEENEFITGTAGKITGIKSAITAGNTVTTSVTGGVTYDDMTEQEDTRCHSAILQTLA